MAPTFKKAKEYNPQLAHKTLGGSEQEQPEADNRQLLIDLGLADDTDSDSEANGPGSKMRDGTVEDGREQQGGIPAYYAGNSSSGLAAGVSKVVQRLRARLEETMLKLQAGQVTGSDTEQVQELLYDQQHQIELLMRGHFSLKGSMDSMRRESRDIESRSKELQEQLEQQHGAALKEMEGKLEKAILQVQQLQLATRERQHQQEACSQLSLQAANHELVQTKIKMAELQSLLAVRDTALGQAQQKADQMAAEMAAMSAASKQLEQNQQQHHQQNANFTQELKQLAEACEAAQQQADAATSALCAAEQEVSSLQQQLEAAKAAREPLQSQLDGLHHQLQDAQTSSQQQQAATHAEMAAREKELSAKCRNLEEQLQAAVSASEQQQAEAAARLAARECEHQSRCRELEQQLQKTQTAMGQQLTSTGAEASAQRLQLEQNLKEVHAAKSEAEDHVRRLEKEQQQLLSKIQDMQQQLADGQSRLQAERQQAQVQVQALEQLSEKQTATNISNQQLLQQQRALQDQLQHLTTDRHALAEQLQHAHQQAATMQEQLQAAVKQQQEAQSKLSACDDNAKKLQSKVSALQSEHQKAERQAADQIKQLQEALNLAKSHIEAAQEAAEKRAAAVQAAANREVEEHRRKWRDEFEKRRKLHNILVEMKGNIRVLARIRPMIEKEFASSGGGSDAQAVRAIDEERVAVTGVTSKEFEFDRAFGPADGQEQVYQEVSPLVTSTLDGFNACIMAYGQTGSGKTYTIEGPGSNPGVNSRALAELFQMAAERTGEVSCQFSASVLEIYNEQIFDLLAGSRDTGDKMDIKEGPQGLHIPGLRIEPVAKAEDVTNVLQKGKQNRSTFATNMNEHSSRSHLVLTVYVKGQDLTKGTSWSSKLHLIDLAGSERVSRSGAEGERLKEAAAINKSLSALGDVVSALQQRSPHIPYRNSKLTRLLEDSLGGSSKTLMIVNCSPASENAGESKCSLEFAARARKVELGAATRNVDNAPASPAGSGGGSGGSMRASMLRTGSPAPGEGGSSSAASSPRTSRNFESPLGSTSRLATSRRAGLQ